MKNTNPGVMRVANTGKRIALVLLALMFLFSVTAFAATSSVYELTIVDGDEIYALSTYKTDPQEILRQTDIKLFDGDELDDTGFSSTNGAKLTVNRGVKVTVIAEDMEKHTLNVFGTVADALEKAQIDIGLDTVVSHGLDEQLVDGMTIKVSEKRSFTVVADGEEYSGIVAGYTVADALESLGITVGENDIVEPSTEKTLLDGMTITVFRVTVKTKTSTETIPYDTVYEKDDSLYVTATRVASRGSKGKKEVTSEYWYVDGELLSENVVSETVITEAQDRVVIQGTKPLETSASGLSISASGAISEMAVPSYVTIGADGLPENYSGCIQAKATAYCEPGGTTSTGKRAQTGYIAVDPNEIPYGTEMYIVSADGRYVYGYCIAADTGGYIYDVDWTVDLYMNSEYECVQWGRRDIIIYFL